MRRTFAEVLREGKIDIKNEYDKLYSFMYSADYFRGEKSLHDVINKNFTSMYYRGTCLTLYEFDKMHGFLFESNPEDFDIIYLVSFCEYVQNLVMGALASSSRIIDSQKVSELINLIMEQIRRVIDAIGYMETKDDSFVIYVEKSPAAISVSRSGMIPDEMSYKVLSYNHYRMHGDIEKKKQTLLQFANILEARRAELDSVNSSLCKDIFFAFNNLNLRHNNIDPEDKNYKEIIAKMEEPELEDWYDNLYEMCLLSILELEHLEQKTKFAKLKNTIQQDK